MQFINFFESTRTAEQPTSIFTPSKSSYKLKYRGLTYEVMKHRSASLERTSAEINQLVGKQLIYRGARYEILPETVSRSPQPKVAKRLCFRGVTYVIGV